MSCSFEPAQLAHLQRIVDRALADLGILNENEKMIVAARVLSAAERGEWDFDTLVKAAKGCLAYDLNSRKDREKAHETPEEGTRQSRQ